MKKRLLHLFEQENGRQLEEDTIASAKVAGWVAAAVTAGIALLSTLTSGQPPTLAVGYQLALAALMLFACLFLLLLLTGYGRYRSAHTFWEYLLSRKHIPLSHWTTPIKPGSASFVAAICGRPLYLLGKRYRPHHRPKHKAPILLFQQAPLLLAP